MFAASALNFFSRIYRCDGSFSTEQQLVQVRLMFILSVNTCPTCSEGVTSSGCVNRLLLALVWDLESWCVPGPGTTGAHPTRELHLEPAAPPAPPVPGVTQGTHTLPSGLHRHRHPGEMSVVAGQAGEQHWEWLSWLGHCPSNATVVGLILVWAAHLRAGFKYHCGCLPTWNILW